MGSLPILYPRVQIEQRSCRTFPTLPGAAVFGTIWLRVALQLMSQRLACYQYWKASTCARRSFESLTQILNLGSCNMQGDQVKSTYRPDLEDIMVSATCHYLSNQIIPYCTIDALGLGYFRLEDCRGPFACSEIAHSALDILLLSLHVVVIRRRRARCCL